MEEVFRKAANKPDLVYLHRYSNASKYATMVRRYFPECRVVYNVADLHFLRMERQAEIEAGRRGGASWPRERAQRDGGDAERGLRHRAFAGRGGAAARNRSVADMCRWCHGRCGLGPTPRPFAERSGTAFVGGFGHPPNVDAVRYLVNDILPLLRSRRRTA